METRPENSDRLGSSEMGKAGYLLAHPRNLKVPETDVAGINKQKYEAKIRTQKHKAKI